MAYRGGWKSWECKPSHYERGMSALQMEEKPFREKMGVGVHSAPWGPCSCCCPGTKGASKRSEKRRDNLKSIGIKLHLAIRKARKLAILEMVA